MTAQDAAFAVGIVLMLVALLAPVIGPRVGRAIRSWRVKRSARSQHRLANRDPEPIAFEDAPLEVQAAIREALEEMGVGVRDRATAGHLPPGRQPLPQLERQPFGGLARWSPIPEHARSARWSDVHRYAPGAQRQTDPRAVMVGQEPPLSFVCVGCELAMPPLQTSRDCPYCGIHLLVRGPRVFWWRDQVEVGEWRP